jgi:hypothetical protein
MQHLAARGGGLFAFVERAGEVGASFSACLAALKSASITVSLEAEPGAGASATEGMIGAILNGPRT